MWTFYKVILLNNLIKDEPAAAKRSFVKWAWPAPPTSCFLSSSLVSSLESRKKRLKQTSLGIFKYQNLLGCSSQSPAGLLQYCSASDFHQLAEED